MASITKVQSVITQLTLFITLFTLWCVFSVSYVLSWHWTETLVAIIVAILVNLTLGYWITKPLKQGIEALNIGLLNFQDGEYATSIHYQRHDEFGQLCDIYNETAEKLRQEKQWLYQRELLLDKVLHNSPHALLLVNSDQHVVFSNHTAKQLFANGSSIDGAKLPQLLKQVPDNLRSAIEAAKDGLFNMPSDHDETQTWHLATGEFLLNNQFHQLYILKHLTRELSRQEVAVWKKVIRVISHELNNSIAPVSSMLHSGKIIAQQLDEPRLARVFATIDKRITHLNEFLQGYGRFAKLPEPKLTAINWHALVGDLQQQWTFTVLGHLPSQVGYADQQQLEQLLVNLLKNAHESGASHEGISLQIEQQQTLQRIYVRDNGRGMTETVMHNALLPFYSTKKHGSGLGLALCREITEAHHGQMSLHNQTGGGLVVAVTLPYV